MPLYLPRLCQLRNVSDNDLFGDRSGEPNKWICRLEDWETYLQLQLGIYATPIETATALLPQPPRQLLTHCIHPTQVPLHGRSIFGAPVRHL